MCNHEEAQRSRLYIALPHYRIDTTRSFAGNPRYFLLEYQEKVSTCAIALESVDPRTVSERLLKDSAESVNKVLLRTPTQLLANRDFASLILLEDGL